MLGVVVFIEGEFGVDGLEVLWWWLLVCLFCLFNVWFRNCCKLCKGWWCFEGCFVVVGDWWGLEGVVWVWGWGFCVLGVGDVVLIDVEEGVVIVGVKVRLGGRVLLWVVKNCLLLIGWVVGDVLWLVVFLF